MKKQLLAAKRGLTLSAISCGLIMALSSTAYAGTSVLVDIDSQQNVSWKTAGKKLDHKGSKNEPQLKTNELPANDPNITYRIGNGYNTETNQFKEATTEYVHFNGDNIGTEIGNTEAVFTFGVDLSQNAILEQLSGDLQADVNYASINLSGNASLARQMAADDYVGTYTIFYRIKPKKDVLLATEGGTSAGLEATDTLMSDSDFAISRGLDIQDIIGDEFVNGIERGSWVIVTLMFEYRTAEEKLEIGGQFSVDWQGAISVDGGGSLSDIENAETVNISLIAHQYGGQSAELSRILDADLLSCNLSEPQECLSTFTRGINYLRNDYPDQFLDADGNVILSRFLPVSYLTERYDQSGPAIRAEFESPLDSLTLASRIALRDAYTRWERAQMDVRRAEYLISERSSEITAQQTTQLNSLIARANRNITDLRNLINNCPTQGPSACANSWQGQPFFESYDRSILDR